MSGLFYGAQLVTPNFYHQVSFSRRKFFLAPLFFIGTTFFRHDFSFWHDFFFGTFFSARLFWGARMFFGARPFVFGTIFFGKVLEKVVPKKAVVPEKTLPSP